MHSLAAPAGERPQDADGGVPERHWALRAEGGDFDQLSGATGTSRAVVEATKRVLQYHGNHRNRLYDGKRRPGDGWRRRPHSCEDGGRHAGLTPSPRAVMLPSPVKPDPLPLVIDVDGALVSGDLLIEGVARLLVANPLAVFALPLWPACGRARLMNNNLARPDAPAKTPAAVMGPVASSA